MTPLPTTIEGCLPPAFRGPATTISRIAAGLSGAAVYQVEVAGQQFVLKIASLHEDPDEWRGAIAIQRLAAQAGLTPEVVHVVDDTQRAVLTRFVADRGFPAFYRNPATHADALVALGTTVRRIHALAIPEGARVRDPREFLAGLWNSMGADFVVPAFVAGAVKRALDTEPPPGQSAAVLSHNDLNPSNLVYDGTGITIFDWATAGPGDPFYDLATLAVFLRMDEATCLRLLAAYGGTSASAIPERLLETRRLVAVLAGSASLLLARRLKHPGADTAVDDALALGDFYQQMRAGTLRLGTPDGQWAFGLALVKESFVGQVVRCP
jgi:aminoglycoside phosphotransferase (APT) family kinase protein